MIHRGDTHLVGKRWVSSAWRWPNGVGRSRLTFLPGLLVMAMQ